MEVREVAGAHPRGPGVAVLWIYWTCRIPWVVPEFKYMLTYVCVCVYNALSPEPIAVVASKGETGWWQGDSFTICLFPYCLDFSAYIV